MFFKKRLFLLTVFILLVFLLLTYQSNTGRDILSDVPSYPLRFISHGGSLVINSVSDFIHTYLLIIGKEEENQSLREKIVQYDQEKNRFIETQQENERLRRLLDLKVAPAERFIVSEVIARDPTNWFQIFLINKGSRDGITKDMVAVTPIGPIGKIHTVYETRSSILLITDVNSSVAVRLQNSRADGILEGLGSKRCFLKYVQQDIDVKAGERVITSGLDDLYPDGLLIGYVTSVRKEGTDLFQEIEVAPAQNLSTVEEVAILSR